MSNSTNPFNYLISQCNDQSILMEKKKQLEEAHPFKEMVSAVQNRITYLQECQIEQNIRLVYKVVGIAAGIFASACAAIGIGVSALTFVACVGAGAALGWLMASFHLLGRANPIPPSNPDELPQLR